MYKMMYILSRRPDGGMRRLFTRGSWVGAGENVLPEIRTHVSQAIPRAGRRNHVSAVAAGSTGRS